MRGRKWLVVVIVAVALLSAVLLIAKPDLLTFTAEGKERVVVVHLQGAIEEGSAGYGFAQNITPRYVERQLEKAAADNNIKAAVLRVNSPGGSVAASQQIAEYIKSFPKPLVVSMGDMAASGGYYISAPARGIVAQPGTITGSIGVISQVLDLEGFYEKLGIKTETIKSGRHKDMLSRELTPEERELMQELSDEIYGQFVADVAAGRNLNPEEVRELATGQIYTGSQALELGLVDRLGGIDEAVKWAGEMAGIESPEKFEFPAPSFWEQIFGMGLKIAGLLDRLATPPEIQILNYLKHNINPGPQLVIK
ncbi:MAG: signal peptide peptidase SppA [Firmicutes bacterium]|nr:signal peptide peptidase SppA [Bacillota bacterium]